MIGRLRSLFGGGEGPDAGAAPAAAPESIVAAGGSRLELQPLIDREARFPLLQWERIQPWIDSLPEVERASAWSACERAWMLLMRDALGPAFRMDESGSAIVVSSLEPRQGRHALDFMERTLKRIVRVLDGVARPPDYGKDLLILFDEPEAYYEYVSIYHPDRGEFALSSGMHITRGCGHYVTTKRDLVSMEPVIAHEMTHGCVGHLALPLWLNEGLAVNTEQRIAGGGAPLHTPQEMRLRHLKFWGPSEVQEFWSGRSFRRPDDGNELSYDLARILVDQLSADWPRFAGFARAATFEDAGAAAAREHLGLELGDAVAALLEAHASHPFSPDPAAWTEPADHTPEPG